MSPLLQKILVTLFTAFLALEAWQLRAISVAINHTIDGHPNIVLEQIASITERQVAVDEKQGEVIRLLENRLLVIETILINHRLKVEDNHLLMEGQ